MIRIKNWDEFQHYKTREKNPGWIKLHRRVIDDYDFHKLPVECRALLPMLWILASENNGNITEDYEEIAFRLRQTKDGVESVVKTLIDKGFLESIQSLDVCYTESSLEEERESELRTESEKEEEGESDGEIDDLKKAMERYNVVAVKHKLPKCQNLTPARKKALRLRLKEAGGLSGWDHALDMLDRSAFLTGYNDRGWRASFDFILQAKSFTKLMEGAYEQSANATKPKQNYEDKLRAAHALDVPETGF